MVSLKSARVSMDVRGHFPLRLSTRCKVGGCNKQRIAGRCIQRLTVVIESLAILCIASGC